MLSQTSITLNKFIEKHQISFIDFSKKYVLTVNLIDTIGIIINLVKI